MKIPKALGLALLFPLLSAPSSAPSNAYIENPLYSSNVWFKDLVLAPGSLLAYSPVLRGALLAQLLGDSGVASPNAFFYTALNPKLRAVTLIMKALCSLKISSAKTALTTEILAGAFSGILAMVFSGIKNCIAFHWEIQRIEKEVERDCYAEGINDLEKIKEEKDIRIFPIKQIFADDFIRSLARSFFNGMMIFQETSLIPYILAANISPIGSLRSLGNFVASLYFFLTKKRFYASTIDFLAMSTLSSQNLLFMTFPETLRAWGVKVLLKAFLIPAVVCFWPAFFLKGGETS